jgi:SAM-dependent methyltransferase
MRICPNCQSALAGVATACVACGWSARRLDGVLDFLSQHQRDDETLRAYNQNYEQLAKDNIKRSNIDRTFLRRQARNLADYVGDVKGLRVCEIGIGQGFLCEELLKRGAAQITAVDVAISFLQRFVGTPKVETYLANAETLPFRRAFDLIVSTDVLEHVLNAGSFLYCVNRALVDGGRVAIRVPYREGLLGYSPLRGYGHQFGHMRSFNKDILYIYLRQAGFRALHLRLDGFSPQMPRDWAMRTQVGRGLVHYLQKYVNGRLAHWSDVIDLPKPVVFALLRPVEAVVVAEKIADLADQAALASAKA